MNAPVLPPANSWVGVAPCDTGVEGSPAITYGITITGTPALISSTNGAAYIWSINLNDGNTPGNMLISHYDASNNLINSPMEFSGVNGSVQFNTPVYLSENPVQAAEAANKAYVDSVSLLGQDVPQGMGVCGRENIGGNGSWTPLSAPNLNYVPMAGAPTSAPMTGGIAIAGAGGIRYIAGQNATQNVRWATYFGDAAPETGGNSGSNYVVTAFTDAGAGIPQLTITRNGVWTVPGTVNITGQLSLASPSQLRILGGANGNVLITDGNGNLLWGAGGGSGGGITDAPVDGNTYGRNDASWVQIPPIPPPVIPTDAPSNGSTYGRNNANWVVIPPPAITGDAPATSLMYGRYNNGWVQVGAQFLALAGGAMTGPIVFNATSGNRAVAGQNAGVMRWAQYFGDATAESGGNTGSNFTITRYSDAGAIIDSPLTIARSTGIVNCGDGITTPSPPPADSSMMVPNTAWVQAALSGIQGGATVSDNPPANPTNGQLWYNSLDAQMYVWYTDPTSSQWVVAVNQAGAYLPMTGGTLTGSLFLNNNPTQPLGAATKQYVDNGFLPISGGALTGGLAVPSQINYSAPPSGGGGAVEVGFGWATGSSPPANDQFGSLTATINGAANGNLIRSLYVGGSYANVAAITSNTAATVMTGYLGGTATVTWAISASDARLKSNLQSSGDALSIVNALPVQSCDYKCADDSIEHWDYTLIAQQLRDKIAFAVNEPPDGGYLSLNPQHLISVLWKAVQQLSARVEALEAARGH